MIVLLRSDLEPGKKEKKQQKLPMSALACVELVEKSEPGQTNSGAYRLVMDYG